METKAHYVLVGFFALTLTIAALLFAVWLGRIAFDREFAEYDVVFQGPVRGLTNASQVRFNGIAVGEVTQLGLDQSDTTKVIARIRVAAETPFKVDSVAQLEPQGLTGLAYIQVSAGSPAANLLRADGGRIPRIPSRQAQLEFLIEGGEDIVRYASETLIRLNALLSDENIEHLSDTMVSLREITEELSERRAIVTSAVSALQRLESAAASIDTAAKDVSSFAVFGEALLRDGVDPMTAETTAAAADVSLAAEEALALLQDIRGPIDRFADEGLSGVTLATRDLRSLINTLESVAVALEEDPAGFVSGARRQELEIPR
ncbi:MAG: MlaD family protein [Caulobacterales bacterium]|nr:MlaD family protein [Caulobacterales bacterium]